MSDVWMQVGVDVGQSAALAGTVWSWSAFCSVAIARYGSTADYITASARNVRLAGALSGAFVAATVALLFRFPSFEIPDIHGLVVHPPSTWWAFGGLLLAGALVTAVRLRRHVPLYKLDAQRRGHALEIKPRWVELFGELIDAAADGRNYVGPR